MNFVELVSSTRIPAPAQKLSSKSSFSIKVNFFGIFVRWLYFVSMSIKCVVTFHRMFLSQTKKTKPANTHFEFSNFNFEYLIVWQQDYVLSEKTCSDIPLRLIGLTKALKDEQLLIRCSGPVLSHSFDHHELENWCLNSYFFGCYVI